jgi:amino acid adenylation domain-containing protein
VTSRVLNGTERHRLLVEWNQTQADFPDVCAHTLFERQAARTPAATALVCGDQRLSYQELNERANQLAHHLRRRGVGPDSLVGISLQRTPLMVIGLLGIWKAGAAYVPMDPAYPADRLAFMLDDAAVAVLLVEANTIPLFSGGSTRLLSLDTDWPEIGQESRENPEGLATPANLAYVIYTSGSTGKPKGALIVHSGLVNYLWWAIAAYGAQPGGSAPVHSSISFDLTVTSLYPALLAGGQVELVPDGIGAQNLLASLRSGTRRDLVKITPAHLELLTQQVSAEEAGGMTRAFIIGGENLTAESLQFWRDAAPQTRLINEYGPTETVVGCCVHEVSRADPRNGSIPIGRPIANTQLYVLDESLQPVAIGEMGELYIGGAGVARGYLNRADLTQERFLPDPFSDRPAARLYKTGDLARYRNDGVLEYLGRVDNQVKVRGYRIELGEVEGTLAGHPQVQSCTVILREDNPGSKQLVGYVVLRKGAAVSADELRRFLRERLPDYMVPAHLVMLDALPLTQNGKVDRKSLPAPTYEDASLLRDYLAPRTKTEQALSQVWMDLLNIERIGVRDDIFELGATSLMMLSAVTRIRAALGVELELNVLFENPTVAQMAVALDLARGDRVALPATTSTSGTPHVAAGAPHLIPIRFGSPGREMLGLYHPPTGELDRRECCLLCNPFGQEAIRAHVVFRILAEHLARSGFHVLRFDYFGTGDSAGEDDQGNLDLWTDNILRADDEIVRRSSSPRSSWIGLRLGATLAALASRGAARKPRRLVLWDPIIDGPAYLTEIRNAHISAQKVGFELRWATDSALRARVTSQATTEALGYPLPAELQRQLAGLALASFQSLRTDRVTLFSAGVEGELARLQQQLADSGTDVRRQRAGLDVTWTVNDMLRGTVVPIQDIRTLILALTED